MERTLITKSTDGVWNLPHTTSPLSGSHGAKNKAADCLSRLVTPTSTSINMLTASFSNGPAFHTRSHTQSTSDSTPALHTETAPHISQDATTTPKPVTADHLDALL